MLIELFVGRIRPVSNQFISTNLGESLYFMGGENIALEGSKLPKDTMQIKDS